MSFNNYADIGAEVSLNIVACPYCNSSKTTTFKELGYGICEDCSYYYSYPVDKKCHKCRKEFSHADMIRKNVFNPQKNKAELKLTCFDCYEESGLI